MEKRLEKFKKDWESLMLEGVAQWIFFILFCMLES